MIGSFNSYVVDHSNLHIKFIRKENITNLNTRQDLGRLVPPPPDRGGLALLGTPFTLNNDNMVIKKMKCLFQLV